MFYGQNLVELGTLEPEDPKEGDIRATFTANGEWRFKLIQEGGFGSKEIYNSSKITPDLEYSIIHQKGRTTGTIFKYLDMPTKIEWIDNNWFEVFIDVYKNNEWFEEAYEIDESYDVGPTPEDMKNTLEEYIKITKESFV